MNYNDLKNNISNLSVSQLNNLLLDLNNGFISEHKYECIKLIVCEIERRRLSKYNFDVNELKVIVEYNCDILWKINDVNIKKSLSFMKNNKIKYDGILRWIPIYLDMNVVYYIYKQLKSKMYSDDNILNFLIQDIRHLLNYSDSNINKIYSYENDYDFVKFVLYSTELVINKTKDTDVYRRMLNKVFEENSYALNHL